MTGAELVTAIENEFKIAISDSDAEKCETVGQVVDLVYSRLRHNSEEPCPSQSGYYIIREFLMNELRISRMEVRPDTMLEEIIPKPVRRRLWDDLIRSLTNAKTIWPPLDRPKWLTCCVFFILPGLAFIVTMKWLPLELFWLGFLPGVGVALISDSLATPFKSEFPSGFSQVKDLIRFVKTLDSRKWSEDDVFKKIREISVEILGVKPERVTLDACWVRDLAVD
jgi:acyl carrier protein